MFDDGDNVKVVITDKSGKNMIGIGKFATGGAGPNVCAVYKPPMSGDGGFSLSTMEGKMELTCKSGKFSLTAEQNVKISTTKAIEIKCGGDLSVDGSSTTKMTAGSPCNYDAPTMNVA